MNYPMKKNLSLLLFAIISITPIKAQIVRIDTVESTYVYKKAKSSNILTKTAYNYSLGIKGLGFEQFPKILNQVNSGEYITSYFTGFIFKSNDNQFSYRLSGNFYNKDISFKNECEECEQTDGRLADFMIKLGFEKNLTYTFLQPYIGFDIGFRRNVFKGQSVNAGVVNYLDAPYDVDTEKNGAVAGPVFGVKLHLINHLSISAESAFDLMYSFERREKYIQDAARTNELQRFRRWELLSRPLAILSLQYNFVVSN